MQGDERATDLVDVEEHLQVGILTRGKPTLGMVLVSLLLQEAIPLRIHMVDTASRAVIERDDVRFALRLASERNIRSTYERLNSSDRAFTDGKLALIRELPGRYICLIDDDIVMPSSTMADLWATAQSLSEFGFIAPSLRNSPHPKSPNLLGLQYSPGSVIFQDEAVRSILIEYYRSTVDVLDHRRSIEKVWEIAFLTGMFNGLGRPCIDRSDIVSYHLDYQARPVWHDDEQALVNRSISLAQRLITNHRPSEDLLAEVSAGEMTERKVIDLGEVTSLPASGGADSFWTGLSRLFSRPQEDQ